MEPTPKNFSDWYNHAFGFGYGSGEGRIVPILRQFMIALPESGTYDYRELEETFSPVVTWLLIDRLCHMDVIEYGSSTRFAWLTKKGKLLRQWMLDHKDDELTEWAAAIDIDTCSPDTCNCGPNGYEEGRVCPNPFWGDDRRFIR